MKIYNVVQGSDEWKELKWGKIGGSTASKLLTKLGENVRDIADFNRIVAERMEDFDPFEDSYTSQAMQHGIETEQLARTEYERIYDVTVNQYGWIESDFNVNIGISTDGMIDGKKKSIEIKCPTGSTHVKYMLNPQLLVETYAWQIVHNFTVLDIESIDVISYRPENKFKPMIVVEVTKDTRIAISKKLDLTVSELVEVEKTRLLEIEKEIETVLKEQSVKEEF